MHVVILGVGVRDVDPLKFLGQKVTFLNVFAIFQAEMTKKISGVGIQLKGRYLPYFS